jgi:hypothetical protein
MTWRMPRRLRLIEGYSKLTLKRWTHQAYGSFPQMRSVAAITNAATGIEAESSEAEASGARRLQVRQVLSVARVVGLKERRPPRIGQTALC